MSNFAFLADKSMVAPAGTPITQANVGLLATPQFLAFPVAPGQHGTMYILSEGGTGLSFVFSTGNVANLTYGNGVPMLPNMAMTKRIPEGATGISVIGQSATGTVRICTGAGL